MAKKKTEEKEIRHAGDPNVMGLRGAVVFVPMTFALFCKAPISEKWVLCSVIGGPLAVLLGSLLSLPFDSLFLGMAVSLLCCAAGAHFGKTT